MSDPLAAFRRKGEAAEPETTAAAAHAGREPYKAFATKDKLRCIDIRTKHDGLAHAAGYTYLTNISYNRHTYGEILLTLSRMLVIIKGRNLRPIVDALKLQTCEFIQEFDPHEFDPPTDQTAPYVEFIEAKLFGVAAGAEVKK